MADEAGRIIGLYQRHARSWAADRGDRLIETAWLDRFRKFLEPHAEILDLGCGSGRPIARYLIEHGHRITGVDSSPDMIAMCRARFPDSQWQVGDMRTFASDRAFDGIIAWDSFFHLTHDDQRRMFPVFRRHAAQGAALMFTSGPHHGEVVGRLKGEALYHASLDPSEYRALLAAQGFGVEAHASEDPDCGGRTIWLARCQSLIDKDRGGS
jgi:SAM-dependent methyltransferase